MPGAGKTTVGDALARLMQWRFVDVDDVVGAHVGDVPAFIAANGIDAFREHEAAAIRSLDGAEDIVISVGGGAVLEPGEPRRARSDGASSCGCGPNSDTLLRNVGDGAGRPLLADGPEEVLQRLIEQRTQIYDDMADVVIDVDGLDPNEIAVEIVKAVCE